MADEHKPQVLTKPLLDRLRYFFEDSRPARMSRNLRKVFFDYLRAQETGLDVEFDMILNDVGAIIELLDFAADETKEYYMQFIK